jgi:group I intron endonuclease
MKFIYQSHANESGIYKILNTHTNRIYIGQAKEFKKRWHDHNKHLLNRNHQNKFLLNDFNKCKEELGHDDFLEFHVLEVMENSTKEERNKREEFYIHAFWDQQSSCYNFKQKAAGKERSCYSNTPEQTSGLISTKMKEIWQDSERNSKRLKTIHSQEYRDKQSRKMKEKWLDPVYSEHQKTVITQTSKKASSERMEDVMSWPDYESCEQILINESEKPSLLDEVTL